MKNFFWIEYASLINNTIKLILFLPIQKIIITIIKKNLNKLVSLFNLHNSANSSIVQTKTKQDNGIKNFLN